MDLNLESVSSLLIGCALVIFRKPYARHTLKFQREVADAPVRDWHY